MAVFIPLFLIVCVSAKSFWSSILISIGFRFLIAQLIAVTFVISGPLRSISTSPSFSLRSVRFISAALAPQRTLRFVYGGPRKHIEDSLHEIDNRFRCDFSGNFDLRQRYVDRSRRTELSANRITRNRSTRR